MPCRATAGKHDVHGFRIHHDQTTRGFSKGSTNLGTSTRVSAYYYKPRLSGRGFSLEGPVPALRRPKGCRDLARHARLPSFSSRPAPPTRIASIRSKIA